MAAVARAPTGRGQGHSDGPRGADTGLQISGSGPSCRGRFLKVRGRDTGGSQRCPGLAMRTGNGPGARSDPGSASHTRSSSVLSKVAQLESKIRSRKKQMGLQSTELGREPWDEESSSSASREKRGARGKKFLKSYSGTCGNGSRGGGSSEEEENVQSPGEKGVAKQHLDSDQEEMRELMESSLGFSSGKGNQKVVLSDAQWDGKKNKTPVQSERPPSSLKEMTPTELSEASFHNKDSGKSGFGRVNSPAPSSTSRNLSGHTTRSPMKNNTVKISVPGTGYTKRSQESLESDRSEIKSLDELFSKADDAEDPTSSSSNKFRLNVLSLDDLAPGITSEGEELKQKVTQESNKFVPRDTFLVEETHDVSDASEGDERTISDAEISEHLNGVSADFPGHKQDDFDQDERTLNSEYSEDFERSVSAQTESVSSMSKGHSRSCSSGGHSASAAPVPRERHRRGQRVTVRDTGVQTARPPFTYCWAKANPPAVLSSPPGTSYIDPVPVASHVISMDAVEALTAYSPSALSLHTLFKQHLLWTQQFVENIHHLHSALVESLEHDKFHYHTLEEAKEYIKNHKPPPLTLEQALEEIQRAQEE